MKSACISLFRDASARRNSRIDTCRMCGRMQTAQRYMRHRVHARQRRSVPFGTPELGALRTSPTVLKKKTNAQSVFEAIRQGGTKCHRVVLAKPQKRREIIVDLPYAGSEVRRARRRMVDSILRKGVFNRNVHVE